MINGGIEMVDIVKMKQDGVQKYPQTHAKAVVGLDEQIKTVSFDPNYLFFIGTEAQWNNLGASEKAKYIYRGVVDGN